VNLYSESDRKRQSSADSSNNKSSEVGRSEFRRDYARLIHSPAFRRLQGKTQLFPGSESDFFRNRLTHSLEVAQIAKAIALHINATHPYFGGGTGRAIDTDLVELAALAHDLGHPPFGHQGEAALNECMANYGGFEGNAQTFRIVTRLEKKSVDHESYQQISDGGTDLRRGLNWTNRSILSIVKYPNKIPAKISKVSGEVKVQKGIYDDDWAKFIEAKKQTKMPLGGKVKTIECSIMDLADDIAYSTYDMEDALKAGFLYPHQFRQASDSILEAVAAKLRKDFGKDFALEEIRQRLKKPFETSFEIMPGEYTQAEFSEQIAEIFMTNQRLAENAYYRTELTSELIHYAMSRIEVKERGDDPRTWGVGFVDDHGVDIAIRKHFNYEMVIMSPKLKIVEFRGKGIVKDIFDCLSREKPSKRKLAGSVFAAGSALLPNDFQRIFNDLIPVSQKKRVICDFIAGMTDRFAINFHSRLFSEGVDALFRPL
jgi:dGTPase